MISVQVHVFGPSRDEEPSRSQNATPHTTLNSLFLKKFSSPRPYEFSWHWRQNQKRKKRSEREIRTRYLKITAEIARFPLSPVPV